jgi:hypothetical protein
MENLNIEASKYTPKIFFDAQNHILEIRGMSYPENTSVFYDSVFSWVEQYLKETEKHQKVIVNMELSYFNSSSSKVIMDFMDMFEEAASEGKNITINWIYDEDIEEALEFGEEFGEELEAVKFNLLKKAEV